MKSRCFIYTLILAMFLLLSFNSCKKRQFQVPSKNEDCEDGGQIIEFERFQLYTPNNGSIIYETPSYNPTNNNEIVYIKLVASNRHWLHYLAIFNLTSGHETILDSSAFFFEPYWTKSGWIIYAKSDWIVYKRKPEQTSSTPLIYPLHYFPNYTVDINLGNILYNASPMWTTTNIKLVNINGELLDSFNNLRNESSIFLNSKTIISPYYYSGKIIKYNLVTKTKTDTLYSTINQSTIRMVAHNDISKEIYFEVSNARNNGLFKFDESNNKVSQLVKNCSSNLTAFYSISSDNTSLLGTRWISPPSRNGISLCTSQIIKLNTQSLNETVLKTSLHF